MRDDKTRKSIADWLARMTGHDELPETVYILGLGRSVGSWLQFTMMRDPTFDPQTSQVWTVNRGLTALKHDLLFVMDDLLDEAGMWPKYGQLLDDYEGTIITSTAYPEFPHAMAYPLVEVVRWWGGTDVAGYLHNSIPYLMALAGAAGVKRVVMFGCDYVAEDGQVMEYGLANVEYWAGLLRGAGVQVGRPENSTLLGGQKPPGWIYGYKYNRLPEALAHQLAQPTPPPEDPSPKVGPPSLPPDLTARDLVEGRTDPEVAP